MTISGRIVLAGFILIGSIDANTMAQTRLTRITPSEWGGTGISLVVEANRVVIDYDCATGRIPRALRIDRSGTFVARGFYKPESPGPIRLKFQPPEQPVRYEGNISSTKMKFRVVREGTNEVIGEYTAERGKTARVRKCR